MDTEAVPATHPAGTTAWPIGTILAGIPEAGEPGWNGQWRVWLGRNFTESWLVVATCRTLEEARTFASAICDVLYERGHCEVKDPPDPPSTPPWEFDDFGIVRCELKVEPFFRRDVWKVGYLTQFSCGCRWMVFRIHEGRAGDLMLGDYPLRIFFSVCEDPAHAIRTPAVLLPGSGVWVTPETAEALALA